MKKKFMVRSFSVLVFSACTVLLGNSWAAPDGVATFMGDGRMYSGTYSTLDRLISVDIDGVSYKGNYVSHAQDSGGSAGAGQTGKWGRAFLFASSANVLQCQLDAEFPAVSGSCQSAEGRKFQLKTPLSK